MAAPMIRNYFQVQRKLYPILKICRLLQTSAACRNKIEKSRYMQKLLNKGKKREKWFGPSTYKELAKTGSLDTVKKNRRYSEHMLRRSQWLSVVFFDEISQAINSGMLERYVNITKAEVVPDMSAVKVFWEVSGKKAEDDEMQEYLTKNAGYLRHQLIQTQILNRVPSLLFVKDLSLARQRELEELFKDLDTGPPEEIENEDDSEMSEDESTDSGDSDDETESESDGSFEKKVIFSVGQKHMTQADRAPSGDAISGIVGQEDKQLFKGDDDTSTNRVMSPETAEKCLTDTGFSDKETDFRQDLYGLQHDALMKKVISAKTSSRLRPKVVPDSTGDIQTERKLVPNLDGRKLIKKEKQISFKKERAKLIQRMYDEERLSVEIFNNYVEARYRETEENFEDMNSDENDNTKFMPDFTKDSNET